MINSYKLLVVCIWHINEKDNLKGWAKICPFLGWLWSVKRLDDSYPHELQIIIYNVCLKEKRMIPQHDLNTITLKSI